MRKGNRKRGQKGGCGPNARVWRRGRRDEGEKERPWGRRWALPRLAREWQQASGTPCSPALCSALPVYAATAQTDGQRGEWPLTYADGGHLGRTWAPHQGRPAGLTGSLFSCIRLRKARAPSLSKLQFNSNKRPGLVWPGTWPCVAVFPGPGCPWWHLGRAPTG